MSALISAETMKAHRATWYVWTQDALGNRTKIRHTAAMRGQ